MFRFLAENINDFILIIIASLIGGIIAGLLKDFFLKSQENRSSIANDVLFLSNEIDQIRKSASDYWSNSSNDNISESDKAIMGAINGRLQGARELIVMLTSEKCRERIKLMDRLQIFQDLCTSHDYATTTQKIDTQRIAEIESEGHVLKAKIRHLRHLKKPFLMKLQFWK